MSAVDERNDFALGASWYQVSGDRDGDGEYRVWLADVRDGFDSFTEEPHDALRFTSAEAAYDSALEAGLADISVSRVQMRATVVRTDRPKPCPACAPRPDEKNHPRGMVFVGYGRGWETCLRCNGSTVAL